jgi:hypothetical protein
MPREAFGFGGPDMPHAPYVSSLLFFSHPFDSQKLSVAGSLPPPPARRSGKDVLEDMFIHDVTRRVWFRCRYPASGASQRYPHDIDLVHMGTCDRAAAGCTSLSFPPLPPLPSGLSLCACFAALVKSILLVWSLARSLVLIDAVCSLWF